MIIERIGTISGKPAVAMAIIAIVIGATTETRKMAAIKAMAMTAAMVVGRFELGHCNPPSIIGGQRISILTAGSIPGQSEGKHLAIGGRIYPSW
jgi:hypothetical protein